MGIILPEREGRKAGCKAPEDYSNSAMSARTLAI
jgi:hypothetical protein